MPDEDDDEGEGQREGQAPPPAPTPPSESPQEPPPGGLQQQDDWVQNVLGIDVGSYSGGGGESGGGGASGDWGEGAGQPAAADTPAPSAGADGAGDPPYTPGEGGEPPITPGDEGGDPPYTPGDGGDPPYAPPEGGDPPYTPGDGGEPPSTPPYGDDPPYTPPASDDPPYTPADGGDPPYTPPYGDDPPYTPGDGGDPPYTPPYGDDPPYTPGDSGDPPYTPGNGDDPPYTPGDGGDPPYTPPYGDDPPYTPGDSGDPPYTPGDGGDPPYTPPYGDDPPYTPDDGGDPPYTPGDGGDTPVPVDVPPEGKPYSIEFVPPDVHGVAFGGRVKFLWKGKLSVKGTVGPGSGTLTTNVELGPAPLYKATQEIWSDKATHHLLGVDVITAQKLEVEGSMGQKGVALKAAYSVSTPIGSIQVTGTVVEMDYKTRELKGGTIAIAFQGSYKEADLEIDGVLIHDITIEPEFGAEVAPEYLTIIGEALKDRLIAALEADLIGLGLVAGFLIGGVATIGAAVLTIAEGDEIAETHGRCIDLAKQMSEGFRAGAAGEGAPAGAAAKLGWDTGRGNHDRAAADLRQKNPGATDDDIARAVAERAPDATAAAQPQIMAAAQKAVWESYAGAHQDGLLHSYEKERWYAWSNIYGDDPRGNPEYAKYRNEHTGGRLGM